MVGNPAVNASFRSVVRSAKKKGSSITYNAWAFARVISEKAEPNCSAVRTAAKLNPIESGGAISLSSSTALRMEWVVWIPQDCGPGKLRNYLLQQLQTFGIKLGRHHRESGHVSARTRQALNKAGPDRIEDESHDDRDTCCGAFGRLGAKRTVLDDHIDVALD